MSRNGKNNKWETSVFEEDSFPLGAFFSSLCDGVALMEVAAVTRSTVTVTWTSTPGRLRGRVCYLHLYTAVS
eukprot:2392377-Amphidinium_carterae.1